MGPWNLTTTSIFQKGVVEAFTFCIESLWDLKQYKNFLNKPLFEGWPTDYKCLGFDNVFGVVLMENFFVYGLYSQRDIKATISY